MQDTLFALALAPRIEAYPIRVRADRGNMHHCGNIRFRGDPRNSLRPILLDGVEIILSTLVESADAVHDRVGAVHHAAHAVIVANVAEDRFYLPHHAIGADENGFVGPAHGNAHAPAFFRHAQGNVPPDEPRAAIDGDEFGHGRSPLVKLLIPEYRRTRPAARRPFAAREIFEKCALTPRCHTLKAPILPPVPRWRNW